VTGCALVLLAPFGAQGLVGALARPLGHALVAEGAVREAAPTLVGRAAIAQVLMAGTGAALRLHFAAEVLVGAGEVSLAVIVKAFLFVAEAVCALLAIGPALGCVNTGLLACGWIDPLRREVLRNPNCHYKQQDGDEIFTNSLDKWPG
jgi:hypothetical protein